MRSPTSHKEKASSTLFQRGDRVEIASNEEGFEGSYYPANIITWLVNEDYIIRYRTLVSESGFEHAREVVSADQIRPIPPNVVVEGFSVGDEVDAYDNDGWWFGKIIGKTESKYLVYFEGSEEENAYPLSSLRVHQEWVDGGWV
ncbi:Agenet-like domain-containing protein [Artemisia annua]|uniref:Agenet-like domain-containing protein n=1 Tax=Artemisia annua TaxID=35608 RepID=A0A2U1NVK9_ARTAN|nr:Agenet-like domain-containing protein [Artemisia annua]